MARVRVHPNGRLDAAGWLILALAVLALAVRLPRLAERPMHCDEAVHAVKLGALLEAGDYTYDPTEYHGPTLNYLTVPVARLRGERTLASLTEPTLRLVPVLFGAALLLWLLPLRDGLGRAGALAAGVLTLLCPALFYYSRYYIQEMLLVFFLAALIAAAWRYTRRPSAGWAALAGVAAGLAFATKETCVIAWFGMAAALAAVALPRGMTAIRDSLRWRHVLLAVAVAVAVVALLLTTFFTNLQGLVDSVTAFQHYFRRAGGQGHEKPWWYYLQLLVGRKSGGFVWSEGFIVALAVAGGMGAWRRREAVLPRALAVYAVVSLAAYSLIPYKTPWLVLGSLHALILLGGFGAAWLWETVRPPAARVALALVLAAGAVNLARQAWRGSFRYAADERNPYAYAHASPDVIRLADRIRAVSRFHPDGRAMLVKVVSPEYWPLPWYLRDFTRVGYWYEPPTDPVAPVVVSTPELAAAMESRFGDAYVTDFAGLRPGFNFYVFIRRDLWEAFIATRSGGPAP